MKVPFADLRAQYRAHQDDFDTALRTVIEETAFIGGRHVQAFEAAFARTLGAKHCISVANGTDAIYVVLKMLGVGPGDEVVTTALSWIATSETISQAGARVVFADITDDFTIDAERVAAAITPRTKAIIPVHLYGQSAHLEPLFALARKHGLFIIEDCAQAHLARYQDRFVGTWGQAGTFSFYPGKNLGAYGDAGAIVTSDDDLATRCRMYANHGSLVKHQHQMEGINSRLDGMQAALLSAKLPHLESWTAARVRIAAAYDRGLSDLPDLETPRYRGDSSHVFHLYVVRANRRDELRNHLARSGIDSAIHYPTALPFLPAYEHLGAVPQSFPVAWQAQHEILSLPMFPEMTDEMVRYVCESIRSFYA